jgi:hypothetical protein
MIWTPHYIDPFLKQIQGCETNLTYIFTRSLKAFAKKNKTNNWNNHQIFAKSCTRNVGKDPPFGKVSDSTGQAFFVRYIRNPLYA